MNKGKRLPKTDEKDRLFAQAYVSSNFNGRTAAIMIGSTPKSAAVDASTRLRNPNVQRHLSEIVNGVIKRHGLTVDDMVLEAKKIGLSTMADYTKLDGDGNLYLDFTDAYQKPDAMAAIKSITVEEYMEGKGENAKAVKRTQLVLHDKLAAIGLLVKILTATAGKNGGPLLPEPGDNAITNVTLVQNNVTITAQDATAEYTKLLDMSPEEYRRVTEQQGERKSLPRS